MNFEEYVDYVYDTPYNYLSRRYFRDADNPLEYYNNEQFYRRFRFQKETVQNVLLPLVFESASSSSNRGLPIPSTFQLVIALRFYATGNFQIVCGDLHKISQSQVSKIVANVSNILARKMRQFIKFPALDDQAAVKNNFYRVAGFPDVLGCIDCTHVPIKNPNRTNGEAFRNRKGWFSINVQIVCGPRMEVYDIVARWPGSVHDSRIFSNSRCCLQFEDGHMSGILIGDSGYAQTSYMFTPVLNPQTPAELQYNRAHIKTRNVIERFNGVWKRRFACLSRKLQNKLPNTLNIISACAILHNICIMVNEDMRTPEPGAGHTYTNNIPVTTTNETERGSIIRAAFISRYFGP